MPTMTKEEITHLGALSRIALTPAEIDSFQTEIDSILAYVSIVKNIAAEEKLGSNVGARYNVMRSDEVTTVTGEHTEILLESMPHREGPFMSVKKILNQVDS